MTNALGIDISKYDSSFNPSQAVKPIDFVIQRAGYGRWKDELFDQLLPGVMQVPIRGAYHYLNNWLGWREQADKFLSIVSGHDYHFYVADFEEAVNTLSTQFARDTYQWIKYVAQKTGKPVLLYTRKGLYDSYISRSGDDWSVVDYWHAQWTSASTPTLPAGRSKWRVWQYGGESWGGVGSEYGVGSPRVDIDRHNGTVEQMRSWLGLDGGTTPPPALDIDVTVIKPDEIESVKIVETGNMRLDNVAGYDVAFNLTGFDYDGVTCIANMYRRFDNKDYLVPSAWSPVLGWGDNGVCYVRGYGEIPAVRYAAELKRFVIINGQKNPNASDDWNNTASAWNIAGEGVNGETYLFTVKNVCTLNQAVDGVLELGYPIVNAGDLDSGRSTKRKYKSETWQSSNDEVANFAVINLIGGSMTTVTRYTGNIETVKPLRDGPGGEATGVTLSKGTFVKGDHKIDRWVRLIEPGAAAGLWVSYTWLSNYQQIEEEVPGTDPPVDPPAGGLVLGAGSRFIIKDGGETLYESTQDTPLKAVVQ